MKVSVPYGNETVEVEVFGHNLIAVASPKEVTTEADLVAQVRQALRFPIDTVAFAEMLKGGEHLLLLVDDITRATPTDQILPVLLEELQVERKNVQVTILIALGTHRKMTQEEIERKVGGEIVASYPVLNHEWDDESALIDLGITPNGTPIKINRWIEDVDLCIGIGNIAPHNLAGWSGGGKILQPGICGKETTYQTHLIAARCPTTNLGKLVNPVRAEIEQVAGRTKMKWVLNTVLDRHGRVAHVVAGETQAAHRRGVALARPISEVPVPGLADVVLVSSHPADMDFWQANKGLYAAERIVKRGGDIVLLTPCREGLSSQREHIATMEALRGLPSRCLYHEARRRGIDDYAALTVSDIAARCRELAWVTVVSDGLTRDEVTLVLGLGYAESVEEALGRAMKRQGDDAGIVILTHGGETLPLVVGDTQS